jgi:ABC-type glycerol-3-phosphate transport system substrate-binding protein
MTRRTGIAFALMGLLALSASPVGAQDESENLRFTAHPDPGIDRVQKLLVAHYEETHPGAKVSVEPFAASPGLDVQYATQAAAGTLADVIFTRTCCGAVRPTGRDDVCSPWRRGPLRPERRLPRCAGPKPRGRRACT